MDQKTDGGVCYTKERLRCDEEPTAKHGGREFGSYLSIRRKYWIWGSNRCPSRTLLHAALMKEKKRRTELHLCKPSRETGNKDMNTTAMLSHLSCGPQSQTNDGMHSMNEEESITEDGRKHEETTKDALRTKTDDDDDDDGFQMHETVMNNRSREFIAV